MASVSKSQIAANVAVTTGLGKNTVANVIDATLAEIGSQLAAGNRVGFTGWLTFRFSKRAAVKKGTLVFNPQTQEKQPSAGKPASIKIAAKVGPRFQECAPRITTKIGKEILSK